MGVIAQTFNHSTQNAGPGTSLIQGQPGFYMSSKNYTEKICLKKQTKEKIVIQSQFMSDTVKDSVWDHLRGD